MRGKWLGFEREIVGLHRRFVARRFRTRSDFKAKITILGEGPRGHLSRQIFEEFDMLSTTTPSLTRWVVKRLSSCPKDLSKTDWCLTAGYPLNGSMGPINGTFGGAFIYSMGGDRVAIGLLAVLDAHNPDQDVQYLLQKNQTTP